MEKSNENSLFVRGGADMLDSSATTVKTNLVTTFDAMKSLSPNIIAQIKKNGELLLGAPDLCRQIWHELRKTDQTLKGVINYVTFEVIFQKFTTQLYSILGFVAEKEFFELQDDDNDGFQNEDEQILLFSLIKAKMLKTSNELLIIYEYGNFQKLMAAIRDLERQINQYQNQMRQKIYSNELSKYHEIGQDKLEDFFSHYERKFINFNKNKNKKEDEFFAKRSHQKEALENKLSRVTEGLKFKPRKKLREYQTQERLVALEERVEEANNFRKELKDLNIKEALRLQGLWDDHIRNSIKNFESDTYKLHNHLNVKLFNEENKMKIKMAKDFDVLQKQIALHENDIKRIQNFTTKKSWARGETLGDLYRLKATLKNQNEIIQNSKKIDIAAAFFKPDSTLQGKTGQSGLGSGKSFKGNKTQGLGESNTMSIRSPGTKYPPQPSITPQMSNKSTLKQLKKLKKSPELIKFYVRQKYGTDIPVNIHLESHQQGTGSDDHYKVEKYLQSVREVTDNIPRLSHLYDDYMEEIPNKDHDDRLYQESLKAQDTEIRKSIHDMLNFNGYKKAQFYQSTHKEVFKGKIYVLMKSKLRYLQVY